MSEEKAELSLNMSMTESEVSSVLRGLALLPYGQVFHLVGKIQLAVAGENARLLKQEQDEFQAKLAAAIRDRAEAGAAPD